MELERWRAALDERETSSIAMTRRVKSLERELARKEKALAEAAALLILKKVDLLYQEAEDDDTDEENDRGSSTLLPMRSAPAHGSPRRATSSASRLARWSDGEDDQGARTVVQSRIARPRARLRHRRRRRFWQ